MCWHERPQVSTISKYRMSCDWTGWIGHWQMRTPKNWVLFTGPATFTMWPSTTWPEINATGCLQQGVYHPPWLFTMGWCSLSVGAHHLPFAQSTKKMAAELMCILKVFSSFLNIFLWAGVCWRKSQKLVKNVMLREDMWHWLRVGTLMCQPIVEDSMYMY